MRAYKRFYGHRILIEPNQVPLSSILAMPEIAQAPLADSGVILDVGHLIDAEEFPIGDTVCFHPGTADVFSIGDGPKLYCVGPERVICFLDVEASG